MCRDSGIDKDIQDDLNPGSCKINEKRVGMKKVKKTWVDFILKRNPNAELEMVDKSLDLTIKSNPQKQGGYL